MAQNSFRIIDRFVTTQIGEPFRLFPFGLIHKNGQTIDLTPELASTFKLPHFKPAIKLGGHDDALPAGGHIIGLEVRSDGIYAIPEWNENGTAALEAGSFRYQSPEILWEGIMIDSVSGEEIEAPIIMGDALLHNPALGEAAAFYKVMVKDGGRNMPELAEGTTTIPTSLLERFYAWMDKPQRDPEPAPDGDGSGTPDPVVAQFEAQIAERDEQLQQYRAQVEAMEAATQQAERVAHFGAELAESPAVAEDTELHALLAGMPEDQAEALLQRFKALSAQIDEASLTGEQGGSGDANPDPDAIIRAYAAEHNIKFTEAFQALARERPELFNREAR